MGSKTYLKLKALITLLLLVTIVTIYLDMDVLSFSFIALLLLLSSLEFLNTTKYLKAPSKFDEKQVYLDAFENDGIFAKIDPKNHIIKANRQFCQAMHITKENLKTINFKDLIKTDSNEIYETTKHKQSWEGTLVFNTFDNDEIYLNCSFIPILNSKGDLWEILFLATDISELIMNKSNIKNSLYIDVLTKLPNRLKLFTDKRLLGKQNDVTCIIFNIDSFDTINNLYGNAFGDNILVQISKWLSNNLLTQNTKLYKLEADIYATLNFEKIQEVTLNNYLNDISLKIVMEKFFNDDAQIEITMTIGASQSFEKQLKLAQIAYNEAKRDKKSYQIYDKKSKKEEEYIKNIHVSKTLKYAAEHSLVIPYYQPIMDISTNHVDKYETLMRIQENNGLILTPIEFLKIAKHSKVYPELSKQLIKKSITTFNTLSHEFSVNLSFLDITNKQTTKFILDLLDKTGIGPWIIFELLESEGIENYKEVKNFVQDVKSYGAKIAIDDFGSGYSNFERIVELQVDYLKIDGSLIKNIHQNDDMLIITKTITNFAKELGIKTVAEYVHSKEVLDQIKALEIDFAQGFYIGEPQAQLLTTSRIIL